MQPSYEEKKEKFSIIRKKPHHVPLTFTMPLSWYM